LQWFEQSSTVLHLIKDQDSGSHFYPRKRATPLRNVGLALLADR